jgi:lysophospholipase L1-like esterase
MMIRSLRSWSSLLCVAAFASACGDDGSADSGADGTGSESGGTTGTSASATGSSATTQPADTSGGVTGMSNSGADTSGGPGDTSADGTGTDTGSQGIACINDMFVSGASPVGDYSMYDVPIGSHCQGTNQQDITGVERIVFLGDSVTVGTPPTGTGDFYRSILAEALAMQFGLEPPSSQWESVNAINGTSSVQDSGAFSSCAVWGARNDDLQSQLDTCFPAETLSQRTLVIFTMGGNDGASIAKDYLDGAELADVLAELDAMVAAHEAAVQWLVADNKFPNGVFVVNADVYEFTDSTFDFQSCPTAGLAGFNSNPDMPDVLRSSLQHINEEYMRIAEENGTDVVFMSEGFCGHGFHAGDAMSPCYRGPGNETWFDLTCIHPTPTGHGALAEMFLNTISE